MSDTSKKSDNDTEESVVVTLPGTVDKIIPAIGSTTEKAQIRVDGAEPLYREIRVDNTLHNVGGEDVSLKLGAEVKVTIEAKPAATTPSK
jgi:ribosomal protein L9